MERGAWVLLAGLSAACGRSEPGIALGDAGGRCYGNGTCDEGLVCTPEDTCVGASAFDCDGVACSGHGRCEAAGDALHCSCDPGYRALGLACVACATAECAGEPCPADMVWVTFAADGVCVDAFEATLFDRSDCSGNRYGNAPYADLPAGFPVNVECTACDLSHNTITLEPATTELYACSLPGLQPSAYVSWFQAVRACTNVGKRLCDDFELTTACGGPEARPYPYGAALVAGACALGRVSSRPTGEYPCEGGFPGLWDLVGNLAEWITTTLSTDQPRVHGGSFGSTDAESQCDTSAQGTYSLAQEQDVGFRCCRAPLP